MVGRSVVLASCVLLGTFFAGCTADDNAKGMSLQGVVGEAIFDADTGGISGTVLSEEDLPIPDAEVLLVGDAEDPVASTLVSAEGFFSLAFIAPGTYTLVAQAPRFGTASKTVDVLEGQVVSDVVFRLAAGVSDIPYHTITVFPIAVSGYAFHVKTPTPLPLVSPPNDTTGCMYGPPPLDPASVKTCQGSRSGLAGLSDACQGICEVHYGHCNTPEGTWGDDWSTYGCDFGAGWKTIISEVESIPQTTTTGQGWAFTTWLPNVTRASCPENCDTGSVFFDDPRAFRNTEEAPIYRWIDQTVMDERGIAEEDRCCDPGWRIFPAPCGINGCDTYVNVDVMQDQRATVYFTYFMLEPAPEGWSAVQDA